MAQTAATAQAKIFFLPGSRFASIRYHSLAIIVFVSRIVGACDLNVAIAARSKPDAQTSCHTIRCMNIALHGPIHKHKEIQRWKSVTIFSTINSFK
ncbi:MAG: hypothetical protein JO002_14600 [Burkholderiaceae bacterium]|nr:hypothetical protein [Burkholderiaceae bacterium]